MDLEPNQNRARHCGVNRHPWCFSLLTRFLFPLVQASLPSKSGLAESYINLYLLPEILHKFCITVRCKTQEGKLNPPRRCCDWQERKRACPFLLTPRERSQIWLPDPTLWSFDECKWVEATLVRSMALTKEIKLIVIPYCRFNMFSDSAAAKALEHRETLCRLIRAVVAFFSDCRKKIVVLRHFSGF